MLLIVLFLAPQCLANFQHKQIRTKILKFIEKHLLKTVFLVCLNQIDKNYKILFSLLLSTHQTLLVNETALCLIELFFDLQTPFDFFSTPMCQLKMLCYKQNFYYLNNNNLVQ